MPLLDFLNNFVDKDRQKLIAVPIDPTHVDRRIDNAAIAAGRHYVRLRLAEMFLKKDVQWFKSIYPAVHSLVRFDFGNQPIEIPNIADSTRVGMQESKQGGGDMIARNFMLTPTVPFNGGIISINAGLVAIEGQNHLKNFLNVLGNFAVLLNVTQLSTVLNVAQPLALGIQELLSGGNGRLHLGVHNSFAAGELRAGYIAAIRASAADINASDLWVVNDGLCEGSGLAANHHAPFVRHDHMLFRVEVFEERDDWESLTSIQEPFQESLKALRDPATTEQAANHLRTALLRAMQAPELTKADRRRVVESLKEQFQQSKDDLAFSNLAGGAPPTLKRVMRNAMSVDLALEQDEPTFAGIIAATHPDALAPVMPPAPAPAATLAPAFYFMLEGESTRGDTVLCGTDVDLKFEYGIPDLEALAEVGGAGLKAALAEDATLGIVVVPKGFEFRNGVWFQKATFKSGKLADSVEFKLRAADTTIENAGLHIVFDRNGYVLYEFYLPVQLVTSFDSAAQARPPVVLDLDELNEQIKLAGTRERTATLYFWAEGDLLRVQFHNHAGGEVPAPPALLAGLSRTMLANRIADLSPLLAPVADHAVWSLLDDPLGAPVTKAQQQAFTECMERVITAGAALYDDLARDPDFKSILESVNDLPVGSRLSIITNCAFLPWEILYPSRYHIEWDQDAKDEQPMQPHRLFGNRLLIECLLMGNGVSWKPPLAAHKNGKPFISFNLNPTIDEDFRDNAYKPVAAQREFYEALPASVARELSTNGNDTRKSLQARNSQATFIYLYCHGQSLRPFRDDQAEMLELDEGVRLVPAQLNNGFSFSRGPIIFLNSCNSGAFSPLSFSTFLTRFREKQALGILATTCTIPAAFAAAFGQQLIKRFLNGEPLGDALFDLRRHLLARHNPLGMFYSLQCHMDIAIA